MRPQIVRILTGILTLFTSINMLAQRSSAGSGPPSPTNQRGPELPIDNGIFILILAGLAIGFYVILKKNRIKNTLH